MLNKLKLFIKQHTCKHKFNVTRWHWVHIPIYEPASVEAEYKCIICGKIEYLHLYGKEAEEWDYCMEDYLKE